MVFGRITASANRTKATIGTRMSSRVPTRTIHPSVPVSMQARMFCFLAFTISSKESSLLRPLKEPWVLLLFRLS